MEKLNGYIGHVVKTVIFFVLLSFFCALYLLPVMTQYSEKLTNIAKISLTADKIEVPTFSICTGWKTSIMDEYKIRSDFIWTPPSNESNLPIDALLQKLFPSPTCWNQTSWICHSGWT